MKEKRLRVAIVQPEFDGWNFDLRFKKCEKLVKIAVLQKPDLICLPELFPGRILKHSKMLWNLDIPIFFGHSYPLNNKKWKNCYSLKLPNDETLKMQEKIILTDNEKSNYLSGRSIRIFKRKNVKIVVLICNDLPYGSYLISTLPDNKIDVVVVPALAPAHHLLYWENFLIVRAIEVGAPIIFINYARYKEDDGIYYGGGRSSVILPLPMKIGDYNEFLKSKDLNPSSNFRVQLKNEETVKVVDIPLTQKWYQDRIRQIKNELIDKKITVEEV